MCDKKCHIDGGCPFSFTEECDIIQNYGCLPTPHEILHMKIVHDKTWACHDNTSKPCMGGLKYLKNEGLDYKVNDDLVTEKDPWHLWSGGEHDVKQKELAIPKLNWKSIEGLQ